MSRNKQPRDQPRLLKTAIHHHATTRSHCHRTTWWCRTSSDIIYSAASTLSDSVEKQLTELPGDWKPPSESRARKNFAFLCTFTLTTAKSWLEVRKESSWRKYNDCLCDETVGLHVGVDIPFILFCFTSMFRIRSDHCFFCKYGMHPESTTWRSKSRRHFHGVLCCATIRVVPALHHRTILLGVLQQINRFVCHL
ncbi:hypothetical protein DFJ58DRAFT_919132 [Suillus subalutaceus]|uniref:uncharacterized protein n=1 Tax=Suillus subalutaceus TaxID=48586 RepID=UPI001B8683FA|nr:uncharacterized protein DFJ58DRAFT_919132 [Suillus subalutaceus]KAG1820751.1 hypothetical protein DFJ58DRAFT_919132 [Suillus subalutaceus]